MSSEIKVNKITTSSGSTLEFGGAGDTVSVGSGATVTGFGKVLQVVNVTNSSDTSTTASMNDDMVAEVITNGTEALSLLITPTSASSKILVLSSFAQQPSGGSYPRGAVALFRDSTFLIKDYQNVTYNQTHTVKSFTYLDSPLTTSQLNYSMRYGKSNTATINYMRGVMTPTSITLLEIAG
jgi:hypothetical protein